MRPPDFFTANYNLAPHTSRPDFLLPKWDRLAELNSFTGSSGQAVSFQNDIGRQSRGYVSSVDESKQEIKLLTGQGLQTYIYDEDSRWLVVSTNS